jgi:hypothetical protein
MLSRLVAVSTRGVSHSSLCMCRKLNINSRPKAILKSFSRSYHPRTVQEIRQLDTIRDEVKRTKQDRARQIAPKIVTEYLLDHIKNLKASPNGVLLTIQKSKYKIAACSLCNIIPSIFGTLREWETAITPFSKEIIWSDVVYSDCTWKKGIIYWAVIDDPKHPLHTSLAYLANSEDRMFLIIKADRDYTQGPLERAPSPHIYFDSYGINKLWLDINENSILEFPAAVCRNIKGLFHFYFKRSP